MLGLKSKTFWLVLLCVNITSGMICAFAGNKTGVATCLVAIASCYFMLWYSERNEDLDV